jgi:hypothetical protein
VNQRQAYALAHPIDDPASPVHVAAVKAGLRRVRRHGGGWQIVSILAVDR